MRASVLMMLKVVLPTTFILYELQSCAVFMPMAPTASVRVGCDDTAAFYFPKETKQRVCLPVCVVIKEDSISVVPPKCRML